MPDINHSYNLYCTILNITSTFGFDFVTYLQIKFRNVVPMSTRIADLLERMSEPFSENRFPNSLAAMQFINSNNAQLNPQTSNYVKNSLSTSLEDSTMSSQAASESKNDGPDNNFLNLEQAHDNTISYRNPKPRRRLQVTTSAPSGDLQIDIKECTISFENLYLMGFAGAWNSIVTSMFGTALRMRILPVMLFSVPFVLAGAVITKTAVSDILISHQILVSSSRVEVSSRIAKQRVRRVLISRDDLLAVTILDGDRIVETWRSPVSDEEDSEIKEMLSDVPSTVGGWILSGTGTDSSSLVFVRRGDTSFELHCDLSYQSLLPAFQALKARL